MRHLPSPSPLLHMTSKLGCDQVQPYTERRHKFFSILPSTPSTGLDFPCTPDSASSFLGDLE